MLKGHCQCGALRYEADAAPSHQTACHCDTCRRTSGAPFVAWFTVPAASFRFTAGSPSCYRSSGEGFRSFCSYCGTHVTFHSTEHPDEIDVTVCSLDDPEQVPPQDHTFTRSKLAWVRLADGLPTHAATRGDAPSSSHGP